MTASTTRFAPIDYKTRFPALDGVRALAVTMVFLLHYGGGKSGGPLLNLLNEIRNRGWIGVDLFFVLSGFLITGILYDTTRDSHYFKRFFARRSVRIFPIFYLVFVLVLVLTPVLHYQWRLGHLPFLVYLGNIAMACNEKLETVSSAISNVWDAHLVHLWSLSVEEQFYLLWPFVVWLVRDRIKLLWTAGLLSLAALVLRLVFVRHLPPELYEFRIVYLLPFRMDSLLIGSMLALLLRGPNADKYQRGCRWLFLAGVAALIALFRQSPGSHSPLVIVVGLSLTAITSAGLIGSTLRRESLAFRIFNLSPLRMLGRYSYGFYVYHLLFAGLWWHLVKVLTGRLHSSAMANLVSMVLNFCVTLAVSVLSYNLYERRFLYLKKGFEYDSEQATHKHAFMN